MPLLLRHRRKQRPWQFRLASRKALRALPRIARKLRRTKASCFAVGLKRRHGRYRRQVVITAFVRKKGNVRVGMRVPRQLRTGRLAGGEPLILQTDVIEAAHPARGSAVTSGDPVVMRGQQGTCSFAWQDSQGIFLITCGHVVTDGGAVPTGSFRVSTGGQDSNASIATIVAPSQGINVGDGAILRLAGPIDISSFGLGNGGLRITEFGQIGLGTTYSYFAGSQRLSCLATHQIASGQSKPVQIGGQVFDYSEFFELEMTVGLTRGGHSGAVLFRQEGNITRAVGIVFGRFDPADAPDVAPIAYAFSINQILSMLSFATF